MRRLVLTLTLVAALLGLATAARLGAVVSVTPQSLWLMENPRLADISIPVPGKTRLRAEAMASFFRDPALIRARLGVCDPRAKDATGGDPFDLDRCLGSVDDALRAGPASGELWLFRATIMARSGQIDERTTGALRNAFMTAPKEGWLAAERVIFSLRLYPLLPNDLKTLTVADLQLVIGHPILAEALVAAYANDFSLRRSAGPALERLPAQTVNRFVSMVQAYQAPLPSR